MNKNALIRNNRKILNLTNDKFILLFMLLVIHSSDLLATNKYPLQSSNTSAATIKRSDAFTKENEYTIKGMVVDSNDEPLPGVNIMLEGTSLGSITDLNGSFTLNVKNNKRLLLIASYIGFSTEKILSLIHI